MDINAVGSIGCFLQTALLTPQQTLTGVVFIHRSDGGESGSDHQRGAAEPETDRTSERGSERKACRIYRNNKGVCGVRRQRRESV